MTEQLKNNFYYKYLDLECNQDEILQFNKIYPFSKNVFQGIDTSHAKTLIPSIFSQFDKLNLEVDYTYLILHGPKSFSSLHTDHASYQLAINIQLYPGSKDSVTSFFELKDPTNNNVQVKYADDDIKLPYNLYKDKDVKLITCYKSTKTVLLNISKIHRVVNHTNEIRGVLSFRFKNDPWHLTTEENK